MIDQFDSRYRLCFLDGLLKAPQMGIGGRCRSILVEPLKARQSGIERGSSAVLSEVSFAAQRLLVVQLMESLAAGAACLSWSST